MGDDKNNPGNKQSIPATIKPGDILQHALQNLDRDQQQDLLGTAAKEALELEIKKQNIQIRHAQTEVQVRSHVDTVHSLGKGSFGSKHKVESNFETGSGRMKIESRSGFGCFVMSVVYGDENHEDVIFLRNYRDQHLVKHYIGRLFVRWYYENGQKVATIVGKSCVLKNVIKHMSVFVVRLIKHSTQK